MEYKRGEEAGRETERERKERDTVFKIGRMILIVRKRGMRERGSEKDRKRDRDGYIEKGGWIKTADNLIVVFSSKIQYLAEWEGDMA